MGSFMVYQLLIKDTDREFYGSWLPEDRVLKKIRTGLDAKHDYLNCWTSCTGIFNSDIDILLSSGDVDFSKSVTQGDEKQYLVNTTLERGVDLTVLFGLQQDSIVIQQINLVPGKVSDQNTCSCD